jgi:hypothetical protein
MNESEPIQAPRSRQVFTPEFLELVQELDDPSSNLEADLAGPWKIAEVEKGYGIFRVWESPESGDKPLAVFGERDVAVSFLVALPAIAREFQFQAPDPADERGFAVIREGKIVGHLQIFHQHLLQAAHVVDHQMRSPLALATLLLNAGPSAILQVGEILGRSLTGARGAESSR